MNIEITKSFSEATSKCVRDGFTVVDHLIMLLAMKLWKAILGYAVGVFVLSALLAPWCFWVVHPWWETVPFRRVFNRVILGVALVGLWPLLRSAQVRSWREVGYAAQAGWWRQMLWGVGLGLISYGIGGVLLSPGLQWGERPWRVAGFALTGVVVALIEETFFRGGLQNVFQRQMKPWLAVFLTSGIYSVLHFLKPSGAHIPDEAVTWVSGFEYLARVAACSFRETGVWRSVVTLWLAGGVLGWAFVRTKALYLSIGLHAGWVFALKTLSWMGGGSVVSNPLIWPVMVLMVAGIECWARRNN